AAGAAAAAPPPVTAHVAEQMGLLAGRNALVAAGIRRGELQDLEPSMASLLHFSRWYGLLHYLRPAGGYGPPRFRGGIGGWPLGALKDLFRRAPRPTGTTRLRTGPPGDGHAPAPVARSEEHTSELQSRENLVCRLLLEKKKKTKET